MPLEPAASRVSLIDVLDRVLDKGIVVDAWVRTSLVGIDIITIEARCVIASIETYVQLAGPLRTMPSVATPIDLDAPSTRRGIGSRRRRRPHTN